ncbi:MAG TPA: hypothetical protein VGM24_02625 [Puia sp.]
MKKVFLLAGLILSVFLTRAQRFFYLESNVLTEKFLKEGLLKASQFVTPSPLYSDYIIKTEAGFKPESNTTTLTITVQDSISFKTIFQADEKYSISGSAANARKVFSRVLEMLLYKDLHQMILSAKDNHSDGMVKMLKPGKDKT